MKCAYLILNYQSYNRTIQLVRELLAWIPSDHMIMIVDNGSPNNSLKVIENEFKENTNVVIINSGGNLGFAKGNNYGLESLRPYNPKYVCVINNDISFDSGIIDRLIKTYENLHDALAISPIQYNTNGKPTRFRYLGYQSFKVDFFSYVLPFFNKVHRYAENEGKPNVQSVYVLPGAFMFFNYKRFCNLGFFYEGTFLYCEERFLGAKANNAGLKNYIVLNEKYVHDHGKTTSTELSRERQAQILYASRTLFAKEIRKDNYLQLLLLRLAFHISNLEIKWWHLIKNKNIKCPKRMS